MNIKKLKKYKKNYIQKKNPQNYHGPLVPNLMKKFLFKRKKNKITITHECQI